MKQLPDTAKTRAAAERVPKAGHYKPIRKEFKHDGFHYRQIAREGDIAIYEQRWSGCDDPSIAYEVVRIRRRERWQIGETFIEPAEMYPKSEAWGVDGFTLTDRDRAFAKLKRLNQ